MEFRAGDVVEVRSLAEIMGSLDARGTLRGLPFMPEMARYCGRQFRVFNEVTKICETIDKTGYRQLSGTLSLQGLHCDGTFHGGCEARCLLFWREEWLKPVGRPSTDSATEHPVQIHRNGRAMPDPAAGSAEVPDILLRSTIRNGEGADAATRYVCQITELKKASQPCSWWDPRPFVRDVVSGNQRLAVVLRWLLLSAFNWFQGIRGGCGFPFMEQGKLKKTPAAPLGLQPGELVRVRHRDEILATLDANNKNRGLWFDIEMLPSCGGTFRVARRVTQIVNERTGEMIRMAPESPIILLEGVLCRGQFHKLCARSEYLFWREAWLERVGPG
jgi:hypothetical protein